MKQEKGRNDFIAASFILAAAFLVSGAFGASIEVNIAEMINSEAKEINGVSSNNVLALGYDVFNSGSAGFGARMRLDVSNKTGRIATLWSDEIAVAPGERKTVNMYWYEPNDFESVAIKARLYRADEIVEIGNLTENFGKSNVSGSIEISDIHVYDNEIRLKVKSPAAAKRIIVYPKEYPKGWIFEEGTVDNTEAGKPKSASVHYETGFFAEKEVTLVAVSEDGKYYGTKTFEMKKEKGLGKVLSEFRDWLGI